MKSLHCTFSTRQSCDSPNMSMMSHFLLMAEWSRQTAADTTETAVTAWWSYSGDHHQAEWKALSELQHGVLLVWSSCWTYQCFGGQHKELELKLTLHFVPTTTGQNHASIFSLRCSKCHNVSCLVIVPLHSAGPKEANNGDWNSNESLFSISSLNMSDVELVKTTMLASSDSAFHSGHLQHTRWWRACIRQKQNTTPMAWLHVWLVESTSTDC